MNVKPPVRAECPNRQSIRLKGYDYSQEGACFVTICIQDGECLFGDVLHEEMTLNDAGRMIQQWYFELENKYSDIYCDVFAVMPNHIHFIIVNVGADLWRLSQNARPKPI